MRRLLASLVALAVLLVATTAQAAVDLGDGVCFDEAAGENGRWNGSTANDDGCITEWEYAEIYSVENLADEYQHHDDGTSTVVLDEVPVIVVTDPLDRPTSQGPIRGVLFGFFQPL